MRFSRPLLSSVALGLVLTAAGCTALDPYTGEEKMSNTAKGGLMERAERFVALGFGLLFEGQGLFVPTLWVMLALTVATAVFRFVKVWRQASGTVVEPRRGARRGRRRTARPVSDMRERAKARAEARRRTRR